MPRDEEATVVDALRPIAQGWAEGRHLGVLYRTPLQALAEADITQMTVEGIDKPDGHGELEEAWASREGELERSAITERHRRLHTDGPGK